MYSISTKLLERASHSAANFMSGTAVNISLEDDLEPTVIESYVTVERDRYFQQEITNDGLVSQIGKNEQWSRAIYYKHLRKILILETFRTRTWQHRFHAKNFLPIIPPQTLSSERLRKKAIYVMNSVRPTSLPYINSALWEKWEQVKDLEHVLTRDTERLFEFFVDQFYLSVIDAVSQDLLVNPEKNSSVLEYFTSSDSESEIHKRTIVLSKATVSSVHWSEQNLLHDCNIYHQECSPNQKNLAVIFFKRLEERVRSTVQHQGFVATDKTVVHTESCTPELIVTMASPQKRTDSINALVAGHSMSKSLLSDNWSSRSQLQCGHTDSFTIRYLLAEDACVNFQGVLVACYCEEHSTETYIQESTGKRRRTSLVERVVTAVFVDLTGPIHVRNSCYHKWAKKK